MFGRRVFGSSQIPRSMFAAVGISSQRQAMRVLPPLIPVVALSIKVGLSSVTVQNITDGDWVGISNGDAAIVQEMLKVLSRQLGFVAFLELWCVGRLARFCPVNGFY